MYGASCTICPDGAELVNAFEMVKPDAYDAILMDIQTPHMNGYEATKAIRGGRNPLGKTIPIIATSRATAGTNRNQRGENKNGTRKPSAFAFRFCAY